MYWLLHLLPEAKQLREFAIYLMSIGTSIGDVERLHSIFTTCAAAANAPPSTARATLHPARQLQAVGQQAAAHVAQEHVEAAQV